MNTDNDLRRRFVMAVDEVLPPAPALEYRVHDALRREKRRVVEPQRGGRGVAGLGPGLRLAASLAALLIAVSVVATLVYSATMHHTIVPSHRPAPPSYKFSPTATTRSADWPEGGPVPADLAGCWQLQKYPSDPAKELCLGEYSFDVGQGSSVGNVVVNGTEIDLFSYQSPDPVRNGFNICGSNGQEKYRYTVAGSTLVLVNFAKLYPLGIGLANPGACGWELDGTYSKLAKP